MSSMLSSQGVVLATAMAVSGTVILLAFRRQKPFPSSQPRVLRSCISSGGKKGEKKKKRVHFAKDVVDPVGYGEEFRRRKGNSSSSSTAAKGMPPNRLALYRGILRDRGLHRLPYSY